ncbi:MAG: hypothetical protein PVI86_10555 [Phycisphaerae bacterium]|jgi:hypothetical protein
MTVSPSTTPEPMQPTADQAPGLSHPVRAALLLIIAVALALRVVYPGATVFCEDQAHACAVAEDIVAGNWQTGGLINSGGFRNLPGFAYLLAGVWWIKPDPYALLAFTAIANILAVVGSGLLMRRWIGSAGAWWGTAFLSAAPWAIHYSRWIWAQHLLFPTALLVYLFLWQWISCTRRWAALGVVLALTLLVQIHLIGVVLTLAVGLLLIWCRPKLPWRPLLIGATIAILSALPYILAGHLSSPGGNRIGYEHFWRVVPSAAMSLSGLGWQLEFRAGYPDFVEALGWRRWPYDAFMALPILLFAIALAAGFVKLWRERKGGLEARRSPLAIAVALVILILLSFDLLGIRTSPTYLPVWYPLPFAIMGWAVAHFGRHPRRPPRRWLAPFLLVVLVVELAFFAEQLRYIHVNGGVPGSLIGRSYEGMKDDVAALASRVDASEVWLAYEGPSVIQDEPAAYLFRHATWAGSTPRRALIRFRWWRGAYHDPDLIEILPDGTDPPHDAYLVRPWTGLQQVDSNIPLQP